MKKYLYVFAMAATLLFCPVCAGNALAARAMTISGTFPNEAVNKAYYSTSDVSCNYTSYSRLEIVSGSLPPGLRFSSKIITGNLRLRGTPCRELASTPQAQRKALILSR